MRFITVRELKTKSADVWRKLDRDKELIVTNNGKPFALMTPVKEEDLEQTLRDMRASRFLRSMREAQAQSVALGLDQMRLEELDAEIRAARREKSRAK